MRTRSASDRAPIFRITWARCTFTVISATPRSAAICLLRRPLVTKARISRSRAVSSENLRVRASSLAFLRRRSRFFSMAWWTASSRSWSRNGLARNSTAPAFMARTDICTSACPVMKMMGTSTSAEIRRCCSSNPLWPGSLTSRTRQDGASGRPSPEGNRVRPDRCGRPGPRIPSGSSRLTRTPSSSSTMTTIGRLIRHGHLRRTLRQAGHTHRTGPAGGACRIPFG